MILREFLYVDVQKVRGLLAQLDEGILESILTSESDKKASSLGVKSLVGHQAEWGGSSQTTKTLGDALFPTLESALESEGQISDLSESLTDPDYWASGQISEDYPAGSLVRITAQGHLFDSRFVAQAFTNFTAAAVGLQNLDAMDNEAPSPPVPPAVKKQAGSGKKGPKLPRRAVPADWSSPPLEAAIPSDFSAMDGEMTARNMHGLIQVARGVYSPGLYLNLQPTGQPRHAVSARLEEGRSFLDSDADVLFARYGVGPQEWTLVGTVGHHGGPPVADNFAQGGFMEGDILIRSSFSEFVNRFMQFLGGAGFADLVQAPAFSIVPIGVYRLLNPKQTSTALAVTNGEL